MSAAAVNPLCAWHEHSTPLVIEEGDSPFANCGDCGCLIATKDCEGCARTFLDWEFQGHDDVLSAPRITPGGDLACIPCARRAEREEEDEADDRDEPPDSFWTLGLSQADFL